MAGLKTLVDTLKQSGALNEKLNYQPGHAIYDEYNEYKAAAEEAKKDSKAYKDKARYLGTTKVPKQEAQKQLAPLAAAASKSARVHAEKRRVFNERYKDVLVAKG
ncbi:hypothetical protein NEMBOFW57_004696 [Staphylotrichum longicolle]|uniref:Uncharacterized protein n=1 Tax=Staphylotrichum longicolle TaxID=669026 RepID=A0AAD4F8I7_9PEZI|nr:hypothetical protein NEMBOFW57_004696 [Staphylotrichum longicolle]